MSVVRYRNPFDEAEPASDPERVREALQLAETGDEIGRGLTIIMAAIDKQRSSLSIEKLSHIFDCISEAICESAFDYDLAAYAIIHAKLAMEYRPSGYPTPTLRARRMLESAIEDYSKVEDE